MLRRRFQREDALQRPFVSGKGLAGEGAHDVHIDVLETSAPGLLIGVRELFPGMDPADGRKLPVLRGLQADAQPVDASLAQGAQLSFGDCTRIDFHGNLRVLFQPIAPSHCCQQALHVLHCRHGGRAATDEDCGNRIFPIGKSASLRLGEKRFHIFSDGLPVCGCREEIAVMAFSDAERDMEI